VGYEIARAALHRFVDCQIALIEATPPPADIRDIASAHDLSEEEIHGVWLGAGVATQIGLALVDAPERFVTEAPPGAARSPPPSDS
jgi:hypothetical protein